MWSQFGPSQAVQWALASAIVSSPVAAFTACGGTDQVQFASNQATSSPAENSLTHATRGADSGAVDARTPTLPTGSELVSAVDAADDAPPWGAHAEGGASDDAAPPTEASAQAGLRCEDSRTATSACSVSVMTAAQVGTSSEEAIHSANHAFDGDRCTRWQSVGAPPQWLTAVLCDKPPCATLPRLGALGLYVDGDGSGSVTVEVQGATLLAAASNAFYTIASKTFSAWTHNDYVELQLSGDTPEVIRLLFNSGPPTPIVVRDVVFMSCP